MTVLRSAAVLATTVAAAALAVPAAVASPSGSAAEAARTTSTAGRPTGHTRIVSDCVHRKVEPRVIESACGDAGEYAVVRHYSFWHAHAARGTGRLVVNDCTPDCARGHFHRYPATFEFGAVRHPAGGPVFSRIHVRFVMDGTVRHTTLFPPTRPLAD